jgi:arginine utilization protein RocB
MKSTAFAATCFLLFLTTSPTMAEDAESAVRAAMRVYVHIVEPEATIDICRQIDAVDATSYEKVYQKYEDEIGRTVIRLGFLVAQEARRSGVDEQALFNALDVAIDNTIKIRERTARINSDFFSLECKTLPEAIISHTQPFEPLAAKFPHEMVLIELALRKERI